MLKVKLKHFEQNKIKWTLFKNVDLEKLVSFTNYSNELGIDDEWFVSL